MDISANLAEQPCLNPASEVNARLDTQLEVKVYPCNNSSSNNRKKVTQFLVKPEGVVIQGAASQTTRRGEFDLGGEYAKHVGRKLQKYELADTRATQLLVTSHNKSFWVVPSPNEEAFSRHSGTCRLLGDRKHQHTNHTLQVGDFLRVGSVGVVVTEIHDGTTCTALSDEKIQRIMKEATNDPNGQEGNDNDGFVDMEDTDLEYGSDASEKGDTEGLSSREAPCCYMCFDETETDMNPLISPCKCLGDTRYVHIECLRKWHSNESDNQICFLSKVDATCSVCKSTFQSTIRLKNGRVFKLFQSCLEPPYVTLLVATKHEMAQKLFNTRFQLSFSTLLRPDRKNGLRPLVLGRSSASDMVLDYRTVSARHAQIRFKNGEFIFQDAGSSNGSYLYLRQPVELAPSSTQSIQFRIGRSMVSMKVVNKWNRRLLRAVRGRSSSGNTGPNGSVNSVAIGNDEDYQYTVNGICQPTSPIHPKLTSHENVLKSLPPLGSMTQTSSAHLDLLFALAYPRRAHLRPIQSSLDMKFSQQQQQLNVSAASAISGQNTPIINPTSGADTSGGVNAVSEQLGNINITSIAAIQSEAEALALGNKSDVAESNVEGEAGEESKEDLEQPMQTNGEQIKTSSIEDNEKSASCDELEDEGEMADN